MFAYLVIEGDRSRNDAAAESDCDPLSPSPPARGASRAARDAPPSSLGNRIRRVVGGEIGESHSPIRLGVAGAADPKSSRGAYSAAPVPLPSPPPASTSPPRPLVGTVPAATAGVVVDAAASPFPST